MNAAKKNTPFFVGVLVSWTSAILLSTVSVEARPLTVDFGGRYTGQNINATYVSTTATGDYDFDGVADDRARVVAFGSLFGPANSIHWLTPTGKNGRLYFGAQVAAYNTSADPAFQLIRMNTSNVVQVGSAPLPSTMLGLSSSFYVQKDDFLNGVNAQSNLGLVDAPGSLSLVTNASDASVALGAPAPGEAVRFLVQAGDQWYVSADYKTGSGAFDLNGATASWYAFDPATNQFFNVSNPGMVVLGSTLVDIKAIGIYTQYTKVSGDNANAALSAFPAFSAQLQARAVDFGADYATQNINAIYTSTTAAGDYNFDGVANDRARVVAFGTPFSPVDNAHWTTPAGKNGRVYFGAQVAAYNTSSDPAFQLIRINSGQVVQVGQAAIASTMMGLSSSFYVQKADFLNGYDLQDDLRLVDEAGSLGFSTNTSASGVVAGAPDPGEATRFLVRGGNQWYVSADYQTGDGDFAINGATAWWYAFDPTVDQFIDVGNPGVPVLGSTLSDITAFGLYTQFTSVNGSSANAALSAFTAFHAQLGSRSLTDAEIADVRAANAQRDEDFFTAQAGQPFAPRDIIVNWNNRGDFTRYYNQDVVMFAMKVFYLNESSNLAQANTALYDMCQYHLDRPQTLLEIHSFHWIGDVLVRLVEYYGPNGTIAANRLTATTYAKILETMWAWTSVKSKVVDADPADTWQIPDSENHHTQEFTVCWGFSKILKNAPAYQSMAYDDGHSAAEHYTAWTLYAKEYLRQRACKGMLVEIDSPSYATGSLTGIYLLYDFTDDPVLKQRAGAFLDLYWALWAEQQFDGVDGGAKARCYPDAAKSGNDFTRRAAWYLCGMGDPQFIHSTMLPFVTTTWQMSDVVLDLALAARDKTVYEVLQRRMGLGEVGYGNATPSRLRTDFGGILRYSYCTPDFIMSSLMTEARPYTDWTNISAQNRWTGVIFPNALDARIYPCAFKNSDDTASVYNGFWSVQSGGTLITQKLPTSQNADAWRVWISKAGLSAPQPVGNWIFTESAQALVGICVVRGGFNIDDDSASTLGQWLTCTDATTPVIIEVARKTDTLTLDSFKTALLAKPDPLSNQVLSYTGFGGDTFTFYADQSQAPKINGQPVNYAPDRVFDSPFVQSDWDSGVVTLKKAARQLVLDFNR